MNGHVANFIGHFDVLVFLPILMAILVSGNVHQPSELGIYVGFFIQWFIVGLAVGTIVWTIARRKTNAAT